MCALIVAVSSHRVGHADAHWPRVELTGTRARRAWAVSLDAAARRLATPECRALLAELVDEDGHPLSEKLDAAAADPRAYLQLLLFRDATNGAMCGAGSLAITAPGSRLVFVCGAALERLWPGNRSWVEAIIIHETLHTLGLGENPPSSAQITERVLQGCLRKRQP